MRAVFTGDLHLTDRSCDDYRFKVFDYLYAQSFDVLTILGDLCDEKDCHTGALVNRIVNAIMRFSDRGQEVHILMGNHDYANDPDCPFFLFLKSCPNVYYHNTPQIWEIGNRRWAFFPHSRKPNKYVRDIVRGQKSLGVDLTLMHQMFYGAVAESGQTMDGSDASLLCNAGKILAGDAHVPQMVGPVEYVGAPYPINFGDGYTPQMVLFSNGAEDATWSYLYPPSIQKLVLRISDPSQIEYHPTWRVGDQVKVVLSMRRSEFGMWELYRKKIKRICDRNGLILRGLELKEKKRVLLADGKKKQRFIPVSYADQFDAYCKHVNVDESDMVIGRKLVEV